MSRVIISSACDARAGVSIGRTPDWRWMETPARMMAARPTGRMVSLWGRARLGSMIK